MSIAISIEARQKISDSLKGYNTETYDHDKGIKESGNFRKKFNYEVFNWAFCMKCVHFRHDKKYSDQGQCLRMAQAGAFPGVMAQATCNAFLSCKATNIEGKKVGPAEWPEYVRAEYYGKKKDMVLLHKIGWNLESWIMGDDDE